MLSSSQIYKVWYDKQKLLLCQRRTRTENKVTPDGVTWQMSADETAALTCLHVNNVRSAINSYFPKCCIYMYASVIISISIDSGNSFLTVSVKSEGKYNKANLRDLTAASGLVIILKIEFKSLIFRPIWPWNAMDDLENNRAPLLYHIIKALCIISKASVNWNWS